MSGSVFGATFEDIFFDGRETHGFGAGSLRVKSARGRGVRCRPALPARPCPGPDPTPAPTLVPRTPRLRPQRAFLPAGPSKITRQQPRQVAAAGLRLKPSSCALMC